MSRIPYGGRRHDEEEEREANSAFWLQQLRECTASGEHLSAYAHRHGLDADEGYRWTRILRRAGSWPLKPKNNSGVASAVVARKAAPHFVRVRVVSAPESELTSSLALRLMLANTRRAELLLTDERQLPRVLRLLEEPP